MEEVIKGYKGFEKDMTCRDFQYEEGKEYEEDKAEACKTGFHACEYPLDCFGYYEPGTSVYHEVEQSGKLSKSSDDSKVAATKIKIGARIGIPGLVQAAIEYTTERAKQTEDTHNTGCRGASSNTGYRGASSNTGDYGASSNTGNCGASSNTGYRGTCEANHPNSVAAAWGPESKAKGVIGATLVFAEWYRLSDKYWEEDAWEFRGSMMVRVDGKNIKEDTWYWMKDGKIVEAKDE
nr:MAG TPA: hypothetical protein [Caudoviricetes sp.]